MIVVTGATGQLGRAVVKQLVRRRGPSEVGVSVRSRAKAADLEALGVRVRQGDFDNPASLRHAFEGATQVLIVSSNARAIGGDPLSQHRSAIDAARAVGATRVVYTSHMAVSETSAFPPMLDHFATERMLEESGLQWTALRNGFYASSGIAMMGNAFETGLLEAPADGAVSWTAHDDLAESAAIILASDGQYDGPTPPLTGSYALDFADLAAMASDARDTPLSRVTITDEALRRKVVARGAPERAADIVLGFFIASRNGEFAAVDPALKQLIGRPPITMHAIITEKASR